MVRRHAGVYQLGVVAAALGNEQAALLAAGPRAVLSHWSAAALHQLCSQSLVVDVAFEGGLAGQRAGIRPHRAGDLPASDVMVKHGLRVTTPGRTLLDLAAVASRTTLERLVEEAQVQDAITAAELVATAGRAARKRGVRVFREVVQFLDEPLLTRSEAEKRLVALCRSAGLPLPRTNVSRASWEVDAVWDQQRLVVEVDGYRTHRPRAQFERDRRKDAELMLAGYRVLRFTWWRLTREPDQVIAILAAALGPSQGT
jgi:very-short-patch-repair endonuclease